MDVDKINVCCEIIKEGLKDIIFASFDTLSFELKFEHAVIIISSWRLLKNKCNHCLRIEQQTLNIFLKE